MRTFIKKDGLQLVNGGYLSNNEEAPVYNADFVNAQRRAEYVVTFAKHAKNLDFKGKEAASLLDLKKAVQDEIAGTRPEYIEAPAKFEKKLSNQLADEALKFVAWEENSTKVAKINDFLQEFNVLADFEAHGLFFKDKIVKLNKIYSMAEIKTAVEQTIDLLG